MRIIKVALIVLLISACSSTSKEKDLEKYMVGRWESEYAKAIMPTLNNTDSLSILEEDYSKSKTGATQSIYKEDGSFSSCYKFHTGEKTGEVRGKWKIKKDTLFLDLSTIEHKKQINIWYVITKTTQGFSGKSVTDADKDGYVDDTIFIKDKRIYLK